MDHDGSAAAALVAVLARGPVMAESAIEAAVLAGLFPKRLEIQRPFENLRELPATGGAYLICDAEDRAILLAAAENVRQAVTRRLMMPEEKSRQADLSEIAARVYWRPTFGRFETAWAHWQVARVVHSAGYRKQLMFGPCWFLRVNAREAAPRFQSVKEFRDDGATYLGPIMTRAAAEEWIRMLEDVFDLCRYHEVLVQTPHGQACSYFDMGRCPAPCNGTISMEAYRESIVQAIEFSKGEHAPRFEQLRSQMQTASERQDYEKALGIKQTMDRAERLVRHADYSFLGDVSHQTWIFFQRAGRPRRNVDTQPIHAFVMNHGNGAWTPARLLGEWACVEPDWWRGPATDEMDAGERCELVWLVAKFLFDEKKTRGLIYRGDAVPSGDALAAGLRAGFCSNGESSEAPATGA